MGDAGSIPLGFLAAALGLLGWQRGLWPLVVSAAGVLALRRRRERHARAPHPARRDVLAGARTHYYQRLVQLGWGHRDTALAEYALMAVCGAAALWSLGQPHAVQLAVARRGVACSTCALAVGGRPRLARHAKRCLGALTGATRSRSRTTWRRPRVAWCLAYLFRFNFELEQPFAAAMLSSLDLGRAAAGAALLALGHVSRALALREPARPAAHRARRRHSARWRSPLVILLFRVPCGARARCSCSIRCCSRR